MGQEIKKQYYAIRGLPGAGKNFLAVLLNRYYNNDDQLFYYSKQFNEYFNSAEFYITPDGNMALPCWFDNKWNMIRVRLYQEGDTRYKIVHEHEWVAEEERTIDRVRRFSANRVNKNWGYDPKTFVESITEGYYVTNHTKEELDFLKKMIFIKKEFGDRPNVMFDDNYSTLSDNYEWAYGIKNLSSVASSHYIELMKRTAQTGLSASFILDNWSEFVCMLNREQIPFAYPLSHYSKIYFDKFLNGEFKRVNDIDQYLMYYERFKSDIPGWWYTSKNFEAEETWKVNEVLRRNPDVKVISYKDLILDPIDTGTLFDTYREEIQLYTERNKSLINRFEKYWGEITF
jgi:hypothetical protein